MIINPVLYSGKKLPELDNPGTAADLLAGKQLVDQYGNPLTGTMPQKSAGDLSASGASIIVPAGYYPSQVSKSVATAAHPKPTLSRSGGTVTAKHVQGAGYTSGGTTTETLTIPTQAGKTVTPTTYAQTAVASGRLTTGAVNVAGDANLVAGNIKSGVSIFGVAGSLNPNILSISKDMLRVENGMIYIETGLISKKIISFALGVNFGGTKDIYCHGPISTNSPSPQYITYAYRLTSSNTSGGNGLATCNSQGEIYFPNSIGIDSIIGIDYGCVQYL